MFRCSVSEALNLACSRGSETSAEELASGGMCLASHTRSASGVFVPDSMMACVRGCVLAVPGRTIARVGDKLGVLAGSWTSELAGNSKLTEGK